MSSSRLDENQIPVDVQVDDEMIRVRFSGGLELATPVARFPRLKNADASQRVRWELVGRGLAVHWPDVDEDISIKGLFSTARVVPESAVEQIPMLISDLLKTTGRLNELFRDRPFTPDGHLVGSIGEIVAEYIYDLRLTPCSTPQVDAFTTDQPARSVQVKLTGEKGKSFGVRWPIRSGKVPDILLCMRVTPQGFEEIYNGDFPAELLEAKRSSNGQIGIGIAVLRERNRSVLPQKRSYESINRWFRSTPELASVA